METIKCDSARRLDRKPHVFLGHLERYLFACLYVHKKKVLDCGAKSGYGSMLLSMFANYVGIADINPNDLKRAKDLYRFSSPTETIMCDLEKEFPEGVFDVVVAFDVIEHVVDPDFFVANICRSLPAGGLLVFSVPHMIENPVHKVLFDEKGIKNLISKYFTIEEFYYQDKTLINNKPTLYPPLCYIGVARKV